jgi:Flp pilus assembly protein TadD
MIHEIIRTSTNPSTRTIRAGSCDLVDLPSLKSRHSKSARRGFTLITTKVVLIVFALCVPVGIAQTSDLVGRLEQVAALIRKDQINEAEKQLAAVLKAAPDAAVALNLMGTIRAKQGRLNEAEALFQHAVRSDSQFAGARMNLAYLYLLKRAPEKSISELREVVRLEPENADAAQKLAELLFSQGHLDECTSFIEKRRLSETIPAALLVVQGDAYLTKGDHAKAEASYLLALEGRLENAGGLLGLAQISLAKGEAKEAFLYLTRVASLTSDSKSPEFLYRFGLIALKAGMGDEAKTALQNAIELKPNEPSYVLALGVAWLKKGDLFEAETVFRRLIELQPESPSGQLHLGYVLLNQKKYEEAREWLEKSSHSNPAVPEVFYYLGLVAQEQNDDPAAILLFEKAVAKLPSYAHARIALGSSYMKLKNYTRARQELETAVKLDPNEPKAHYNLALLYARLKEPERAQEEMRIVEALKTQGAGAEGGVVVLPPTLPPP